MCRVLPFLLIVLCLTLTSCASRQTQPTAYVPPRVDCAAFDPPLIPAPVAPLAVERHPVPWQVFAWGWQAYAEGVLIQRLATAQCIHKLKQEGVIR